MILTGSQIEYEVQKGSIIIEPFDQSYLNPNSYNYRLGSTILIPEASSGAGELEFKEVEIPNCGLILSPGEMYLGCTYETIGSNQFITSLIGRSSIGRLGLFLQCSANLGHTGSIHKWTLELVATISIRVYPKMVIGQVSFWNTFGKVNSYQGYYGNFSEPQISKLL